MIYVINAKLGFVDEGASAEFYNIVKQKVLGFKQFKNKNSAISAYNTQKLLSKFHLAPKVMTKVCKLPIIHYIDRHKCIDETNWGFVTEKAKLVNENKMRSRMTEIQKLVETIHKKTGLKFWDCHYSNVGYVKRANKSKLVCIDTGVESFLKDCNAWGFNFPGPKCTCCKRYQCICVDY